MTQDPLSRADSPDGVSLRNEQQHPSKAVSSGGPTQPGLKDLLRTLAAHGAGAASNGLAFDLVLHEIAAEAREATQATGAAIAWMRDGEMVCRATTGENAPNLGVRVDIRSGLAGACVETGQIQNCSDTDTDSRLNPELCRQLGIRSMLVAPILMAHEIVGILQLYSSQPDAFGKKEIVAVRPFISRAIEASIEAQRGDQNSSDDTAGLPFAGDDNSDDHLAAIRDGEDEMTFAGYRPSRLKTKEVSNSILLIAVLALAILLGLVLGWRWGREQVTGTSARDALRSNPIAVATSSESSSPTATVSSAPAQISPTKTEVVAQNVGPVPRGTPAGGLVILQDGKVIYRSLEQASNSQEYAASGQGTRLLRRVEPEYPPEALARHVQGRVVLDVKVRGNGTVSEVVVLSGDQLLTAAAVEAVKQWQFQASDDTGGGERQTRVTIRFILPAN